MGVERIQQFAGAVPIMVQSNRCRLHGLSPSQLVERGEEEYENGGYFICNGLEKLIRMIIVQRRFPSLSYFPPLPFPNISPPPPPPPPPSLSPPPTPSFPSFSETTPWVLNVKRTKKEEENTLIWVFLFVVLDLIKHHKL